MMMYSRKQTTDVYGLNGIDQTNSDGVRFHEDPVTAVWNCEILLCVSF